MLLLSHSAIAKPLGPAQLPDELRPWVPWVLDGLGDKRCTLIDKTHVCAWLGQLQLDADDSGARFVLQVLTERDSRVPLPGSAKLWPQSVAIDGEAQVVLEQDGQPVVMLAKGRHVVEGRLLWRTLPEVVPVPYSVARVSLTLRGQQRAARREADGGVWLGGQPSGDAQAEADRLELRVMRLLADGVPLVVQTRIELRASGRPREVRLPPPLLPGGALLSLRSDTLDARIDGDGALVMVVKKGQHELQLEERHSKPPAKLSLTKRPAPWPAEEAWVWRPRVLLRQADISGGTPIDPSRTQLPVEWHQFQAFKLRAPADFEIRTQRRGHPEPPPNRLRLYRQLWLDLDGQGFTAVDRLTGSMHRDWRLRFAADGVLGKVTERGIAQLITRDLQNEQSGVEVRAGNVQAMAEWRGHEAPTALPAVGWASDVERLAVDLNLPPGWELLAASGAEAVSSTRLDAWDALDLMWLLGVLLAVGQLVGWRWTPLAALALLLSHDSPFAPWWLWGALLATMALMRVVPTGRLHTAVRFGWWASAALLVIGLVRFAAEQARNVLYPQAGALAANIERNPIRSFGAVSARSVGFAFDDDAASYVGEEGSMGNPNATDELGYMSNPNSAGKEGSMGNARAFGEEGSMGNPNGGAGDVERLGRMQRILTPAEKEQLKKSGASYFGNPFSKLAGPQQDPNAVIQTGHGIPNWRFSRAELRWSGPVEQDHQLKLWLLSPLQVAALSMLGVLLSGWLGILLLSRGLRLPPPTSNGESGNGESSDGESGNGASAHGPASHGPAGRGNKAAAAAAVLGAMVLLAASSPAHAEPTSELLGQLRERISRAPNCSPDCVSVSTMSLRAAGDELDMVAEVHVGGTSSYALPGPASNWLPALVEVDGEADQPLVLLDEHLRLRLQPGTHRVHLRGPLAGDALTLALGTQPHSVQLDLSGWEISGIDPSGHAESAIVLRRNADQAGASAPSNSAETSATTIPPWLEVKRVLEAGVRWTLHTTLRRVSAPGAPVVIRFPLLKGERVLDEGFPREGNTLLITMDRDATSVSFDSALATTEQLTLEAPRAQPWSEVWLIRCSKIWRCSSEGIDPELHVAPNNSWAPQFRPWPGERVTLRFARPKPAPGRSMTVVDATLKLTLRERNSEAALDFGVETSTGGVHAVRIPEGVRVSKLTVDNVVQPATAQGSEQQVMLSPGRHRISMQWQQPSELGLWYRTPHVILGDQLTNANVVIELPRDRWLLFAGGEAWGTEVQWWGYLALLMLIGCALSRIPASPLRLWQWLLLSLGLTQVHPVIAAMIAGWFFVIAYRRRWQLQPRAHNLMQLAVGTLSLAFIIGVVMACYSGIAKSPDMMLFTHGHYSDTINWYADQTAGGLPRPWLLSTSTWLWRAIMAVWSAWLAMTLLRFLPRAWHSFSHGGLWLAKPAEAAAITSGTTANNEMANNETADNETADNETTDNETADNETVEGHEITRTIETADNGEMAEDDAKSTS